MNLIMFLTRPYDIVSMNENGYDWSISVISDGDQLIEPRLVPLAFIDGLEPVDWAGTFDSLTLWRRPSATSYALNILFQS